MAKFKMKGFPKHGEISKSPVKMGAYTGDFGYDESGKSRDNQAAAKTIGAGAAQGAIMGAKYGPWGAAAGAVIGGAAGVLSSNKAQEAADIAFKEQQEQLITENKYNEYNAAQSNYDRIKSRKGVGTTNIKDVQVEDNKIENNRENTANKLAERYT